MYDAMKVRRLGWRHPLILGFTTACVIGVTACATTTGDFKSEGEKFLQSPELAKEAGYKFTNALCEEPTSITKGTQFTCTATDNDGDDWEFVVEITGDRELTVVSGDLTK